MKTMILSVLSLVLIGLAYQSNLGARATTLNSERAQALSHTAFPGPMRTYENCLGQGLLDGVPQADSQMGCRTLAFHQTQETLGMVAANQFVQEIKKPGQP